VLLALPVVGAFAALLLGGMGCRPHEAPESTRAPQLIAVGEVVDAAGAPAVDRPIEAYRLRLVANGNEIIREYAEDDDGKIAGIQTDGRGLFRILDDDFVLAHEWDEDVWVCEDVCTTYETTCVLVDEEVCTPVCQDVTYDECWDECYDDCWETCEDVTTCDDSGCYTETICTQDCTTICEPVCQTVTETQCFDDCHWESHEECSDSCIATVEECGWETFHHVDPVALSEVESATAEITWRDADGNLQTSIGSVLTSGEQETCPTAESGDESPAHAEQDACRPFDLWVQRDKFTQSLPE